VHYIPTDKINASVRICIQQNLTNVILTSFATSLLCTHPRSYAKIFLTQCLINHLCGFHHIYNFSAVRNKDELIRFWGQRSRSWDHLRSEITCL